MSGSKELDVRMRIAKVIENRPEFTATDVWNHLRIEGIPRRTVFTNYKKIKNGGTVDRKPRCDRNRYTPQAKKDKIIETAVNEVGISYVKLARICKSSDVTVKNVLKEAGVKRLARKKCPKSDEGQKQRQKTRLRKLRNDVFKASNDCDVIMDDEKYFTVDGSDTNFNNYYYGHECLEVPDSVKFKETSKFPEKIIVWIAISIKGMSNLFVAKSKIAVNQTVYRDKCLPKLKKFIDTYHSDGNYIFWPDLASSHYAKTVQEEYKNLGIKYLAKDANPPNVPQLRPIETFWAYLSEKVYAGRPQCKTVEELITRIKNTIKNIKRKDNIVVRNLMKGVGRKVRAAANRGVLSVINR